MPRVITIDPGKSKCGLVLAEISEKKVYEAIILKSELLENYVRHLIAAEDILQIIIGNGTTSKETREKLFFFISVTCDPFDLILSLVSLSIDLICKSIDLRFNSLSPRIELAITSPFLTINLFSSKSGDTKT